MVRKCEAPMERFIRFRDKMKTGMTGGERAFCRASDFRKNPMTDRSVGGALGANWILIDR